MPSSTSLTELVARVWQVLRHCLITPWARQRADLGIECGRAGSCQSPGDREQRETVLYSAREIARGHGGGIAVNSHETETAFTVRLPRLVSRNTSVIDAGVVPSPMDATVLRE
jgi:hypothetical protein